MLGQLQKTDLTYNFGTIVWQQITKSNRCSTRLVMSHGSLNISLIGEMYIVEFKNNRPKPRICYIHCSEHESSLLAILSSSLYILFELQAPNVSNILTQEALTVTHKLVERVAIEPYIEPIRDYGFVELFLNLTQIWLVYDSTKQKSTSKQNRSYDLLYGILTRILEYQNTN